jgi:hypothetical protein
MDIVITVTGGLLDLRTVSRLDTRDLPDDVRVEVDALCGECLVQAPLPDDGRARDARRISIEADGRTVSFLEHLAPAAWRSLRDSMPPGRLR